MKYGRLRRRKAVRFGLYIGVFFLSFSANSGEAGAPEYLTRVDSAVFQAPKTANEIHERAKTCIAENLAPGAQGGQLIISDDGTTIVANSVIRFSAKMVPWTIRTRMILEAREGRFRISHTNIESFNEYSRDWIGVGKWFGSDWKTVESSLQDVSTTLAQCVMTSSTDSNW
jgi:hypothetical protein